MSNPVLYSAKDFERYHRGEMTSAERHALEKAALNDPMLADALEGYAHTTTAPEDLLQLQSRLQHRIPDERKRRPVFRRSGWLKIAALVIFIAASGWLVFQTLGGREEKLAAERQEHKTIESATSAAGDSISTTRLDSTNALYGDTGRSDTKLEENSGNRNGITATTAMQNVQTKAAKNKENAEASLQTSALADQQQIATATEKTISKDNTASPLDRLANDTTYGIAAAPGPASQDNISVKRKTAQSAANMRLARTAEPVNGWPAFEKYVEENKRSAREEAISDLTNGAVELLFDLDKKGKPINITIAQSACKTCDEEAIRLLKEGPRWKGAGGRVMIRFPK